jgi:predicted helicase
MLAGENLGLIATRQTRDEWHVFSTTKIIGHKSLAAYDINTLFPLYLYPNGELPESLFDYENERRPNLASGFIDAFAKRLKMRFTPDGVGDMKKTLGPEDVFYYLYAVFHSPTYRSRYREFLKVDFPRVPVTSKAGLFRALRNLGCRLVELHLLENPVPLITKYRVQGDNRVEGVSYADGRVWINKTQCFEDVPREVWEFRIGGYQVCEKWLKDRKGHMLSYDDYRYYQQIVCALAGTIRIMAQIDAAIDRSGGWPLK